MSHPKNELAEHAQKRGLGKPKYRTRTEGSAHEPVFKTEVLLDGSVIGRGEGGQKRASERQAAENALEHLLQDAPPEAPAAPEAPAEGPFEGPWPVFEAVLAGSLHVANSRIDPDATGPEAVRQVRDLALGLYKDLLENLGEVVEVDD